MQSKTIGIITFQKNIYSYGASLQTYATYKFFENEGFRPFVIDLLFYEDLFSRRNKNHNNISRSLKISCIKGRLFYYIHNPQKALRFKRFNKQLKYSKTYYNADQLYDNPPIADVYCTGSDQTLNPKLTIVPEAYLLGFTNGKKIAFSSSIGEVELDNRSKGIYAELLKQYSHISVREEKTKDIIMDICDRDDIALTLDPTLLLPIQHYNDICKEVNVNSEYMIFFSLYRKYHDLQFAEKVAKINNLELIVIGQKQKGINARFISNMGPRQWLGYIRNAKHILTDSFHGTVFSMLMNDNFMSLVPRYGGFRINHLLKMFDLEQHRTYLDSEKYYDISITKFNKKAFIEKLEIERKKTIDWLIKAILSN